MTPPGDELLARLRSLAPHPATERELVRRLRVPREERKAFARQLRTLVDAGELLVLRGNRFAFPEGDGLVVGRLVTNPGGFGFVVAESVESGDRQDLYISPANLGEAMHGDRVTARVERRTAKGLEGRIVGILERRHRTIVGRFEVDASGLGVVVPFDPRVLTDVHVPTGQWSSAETGEMVLVELTRWPTQTRAPAGRVVKVLGHIDEPGVDTEVIIHRFGIPDAHSDEAVREAGALGAMVVEADLRGRTDFRDVVTVTIDGEHARDFDDAVTIAALPNGHFRLGVHIADVSHYVTEGSALDEEAYDRGTSVYFTERAVHMFPAELSTGLCSLNPRVDRLVQSCVMDIDRRGQVVGYELHDGVIHSDARMTYAEVHAILVEREPEVMSRYEALVPMFERMRDLFEILNQRRRRRGSIDFDLPEPEVMLSEEGAIESIVAAERNVAHRIIEEFMLLANETVAAHLVATDVPVLHRVHEAPDAAKVEEFEAFIATLGYSLAATGRALTPRHFQSLVDRIHGTPEERPIASRMLRTMQKARYDPTSLGHFGLAAEHYAHFTSPIRRYPDLIVHRMLREGRRGPLNESRRAALGEDLPEAARHLSEMERRADDAERELLQWKKVRFMSDKIGDQFTGSITGVAAYGLFVELEEHYVEGLVQVSSMADDYYRFVEQQHVLYGEKTQRTYRLGDRVLVQVIRVDLERRQVDLGLVESLDRTRQARAAPATKRAKIAKTDRRGVQRPGRRERHAARRGERRRR